MYGWALGGVGVGEVGMVDGGKSGTGKPENGRDCGRAKTWGQTALSTAAARLRVFSREMVAPWDRVVSPHVFAVCGWFEV